MNLVIANTTVGQDEKGRYCINDLHRAAGGENRHRPSIWAENKQTEALIALLSAEAGIPALVSQHGGSDAGTFVCKELVYAYAMWISPEFHVRVIRAYDAMVAGRVIPTDHRETVASMASDFAAFREAGMSEQMALFVADVITANLTGKDPIPQFQIAMTGAAAADTPAPVAAAPKPPLTRRQRLRLATTIDKKEFYELSHLAKLANRSYNGLQGKLTKLGWQVHLGYGEREARGLGVRYSKKSGKVLLWRGDLLDALELM